MTDLVPDRQQKNDKLGISDGKHTAARDKVCNIPVTLIDCYVSVQGVLSLPEARLIVWTVLLLPVMGVTLSFSLPSLLPSLSSFSQTRQQAGRS